MTCDVATCAAASTRRRTRITHARALFPVGRRSVQTLLLAGRRAVRNENCHLVRMRCE